MTAWLLTVLGRLRAPWWAALAVAAGVLVLLPIALLLDATLLFIRVVRVGAWIDRTGATCPRGHVVRLREENALWSCASCGYGYLGSGLASCPRCRAVAAFVQCPCGASLPNPVFEILGERDAP